MIGSIALSHSDSSRCRVLLLLMLLIDFLVRRADVTAGLLIGSTLVRRVLLANEVPSITLPGDTRVDRPILSQHLSCALLSHGFFESAG